MSCSMSSTAAPRSRWISRDARRERLGLALRQARGRLVEQEHARAERELARELDHSPGPGRQRRHRLVGGVAEAERREDVVGLGALAPVRRAATAAACSIDGSDARPRPSLERDHDRLAHGEVVVEAGGLERCGRGRAGAGGTRGDRVTSCPSTSTRPVGGHEPADRVHERALPRAVGADEPDQLAGTDPQVDAVDRDPAAEPHRHPRRHQPVARRHRRTGVAERGV